ncbi:MAG: HAD family hydrolase [Rikenellaceae bacterium]|nr:HAD family hydrolase [Rikenellaceae bacterium]
MTQKRLVIFDLDGTLLNTIADLAQAVNQALVACGFEPHPTEAYRFFVGDGVAKLFERALPPEHRSADDIANIRSHFMPYYEAHNADLSRPYDGVVELLAELTARGVAVAVASNKYDAATQKLVAHYFGSTTFAAVFGQREGVPVKPNPQIVADVVQKAAENGKLEGLRPEEVLYVGDSNVDMLTAHNAGVDVVGVSWGFRPREELAAHSPMAIIDHPMELLDWIS